MEGLNTVDGEFIPTRLNDNNKNVEENWKE